jgi:hypothetical protein
VRSFEIEMATWPVWRRPMARAAAGDRSICRAAYKRPAIIDPHNHATTVTNSNKRPEWQGAVSRGHCRTIEMLSICGATTAKAVASTVNACHFRTRNLTAAKQQRTQQQQFQTAKEQSAHIATSAFSNLPSQSRKDSTASPNRLNQTRIGPH